jgi:hypothetical protein
MKDMRLTTSTERDQTSSDHAICRTHLSNKRSTFKATVHVPLDIYLCEIQNIATKYITGPQHSSGTFLPVNAEARSHYQTNLCWIYGTDTGVSPSVSEFPCRYHSTNSPYSFSPLLPRLHNLSK